jgi:hypothetical protein
VALFYGSWRDLVIDGAIVALFFQLRHAQMKHLWQA